MSAASFHDFKEGLSQALKARQKRSLPPDGLVPAAVLLPLYEQGGQAWLLLTKRTEEVAHHKGQVSFPGGAQEGAETLQETALRESYEEIGLRTQDVEILGELDDAATRSQFHISPFVGVIPYPYSFRPSRREIQELVSVPLAALCQRDNFREAVRVTGRDLETVYFYTYENHLIWGATARILKQLLDLVCAGEETVVRA